MVTSFKVSGLMIRLTGQVSTSIMRAPSTKETGSTTSSMGRGKRRGKTVRSTSDSTSMG